MQTFWLVITSMLVAAFIGGLTNFLAIKMLFHPREAIYLGSWKIPLTPGIIPKRRDEIATSLGKIVSEHLVTQDSIRGVIQRNETSDQVEKYVYEGLHRLSTSQVDIGEWMFTYFAVEKESYDSWKERLQISVQKVAQSGASWIWKEISPKTLKQLLPKEMINRQGQYAEKLAEWILGEAERFLVSPEGEVWLESLLNNVLQRTSGFKGLLAGFFMGDPRMGNQIHTWLLNGLRAPGLRTELRHMIALRIEAWTNLTVEESMESLKEFDDHSTLEVQEISSWFSEQLVSESLLDSLLNRKIGEVISFVDPQLRAGVPEWSKQALNWVEKKLPVVLENIDLPHLVERQVRAFPVEQVERIVLEVSGREFRAITWLGALLGGMIGLVQSIFYLNIL